MADTTTIALSERMVELGCEAVSVQGENVMCRCPFHPDRTPSFSAHPLLGAHCFSCKKKFHNSIAFLRGVAGWHGIAYDPIESMQLMPLRMLEPEPDPEPLNAAALRFYTTDVAYFVREWGVAPAVVERHVLKLDPDNNDECFPIFDWHENYWGCVHRTPPRGGLRSKYRYPPGWPKSRYLLGEYEAMAAGAEEVWVTEGIRDALAIESRVAGVHAVAIGSSDPSPAQINKLKQFGRIVTCFDHDPAGQHATDVILKEIPPSMLSIGTYKGADPAVGSDFQKHTIADLMRSRGSRLLTKQK